jgi:hypothetical protein
MVKNLFYRYRALPSPSQSAATGGRGQVFDEKGKNVDLAGFSGEGAAFASLSCDNSMAKKACPGPTNKKGSLRSPFC